MTCPSCIVALAGFGTDATGAQPSFFDLHWRSLACFGAGLAGGAGIGALSYKPSRGKGAAVGSAAGLLAGLICHFLTKKSPEEVAAEQGGGGGGGGGDGGGGGGYLPSGSPWSALPEPGGGAWPSGGPLPGAMPLPGGGGIGPGKPAGTTPGASLGPFAPGSVTPAGPGYVAPVSQTAMPSGVQPAGSQGIIGSAWRAASRAISSTASRWGGTLPSASYAAPSASPGAFGPAPASATMSSMQRAPSPPRYSAQPSAAFRPPMPRPASASSSATYKGIRGLGQPPVDLSRDVFTLRAGARRY
jgi:hypothetical protein